MKNNNGNVAVIVVSVIVALVIGFGVGQAMNNSDDDSNSENSSTVSAVQAVDSPAADTRVALNNALREHVNIAGVALRNVYTDSPDADAAVAALDENSKEVAGLVGSVYGDDAEEQFLSLWRSHIGFFADYTVAAKNSNQEGMDQALADLAGYGKDASAFFESANPNLPASAVMPLLEEHRNLVIDTINLIGAGDFDAAYLKLAEAADQVGTIGDALATGLVKQSPEKF
jgi:hypothetical protein